MKTEIFEKTSQYNDTYINVLQQAWKIWDEYKSMVLTTSAKEFRPIISLYFENRTKSPLPYPPLNAYLPLLLAEPFGLIQHNISHHAALANLYLDHFTQVLDDATDCGIRPSSFQLHLSHHLLMEGMNMYLQLTNDAKNFSKKLDRYFNEAMNAERTLWRHHKNIIPYEDRDFITIGQRCALVKSCVALYADITGKYPLQKHLEKGIDELSTAVQLVDDLIDWKDDWKAEIYTHPLVLAIEKLNDRNYKNLKSKQIEHAVFLGNIWGQVILRAKNLFVAAQNSFEQAEAHSMALLTNDLLANVNYMDETLTSLIKNGTISQSSGQNIVNLLLKKIDIRLMH